ncbi:hypothetical protein ASG49_09485 [Marmoricola sp. Leaf446]|uniref:hypothetical protein n=1 Tax=Marmoricola sp. Leaf446 TaxID=1736379 RepID=UPI0007002ED2|nr:hypothetical protein [Marmoricola sp. Leaf446]KQT92172.1 hypothetical protein ASG49_09485 [Marmoricola sp. Leaf446]
MPPPTLVSTREALAVLRSAGVGARAADRVLAGGLAGAGVRTRSVLLHDLGRVRQLAERPVLAGRTITEHCPQGLFVARRDLPPELSRADQERWFAGGWGEISGWVRLRLQLEIERCGPRPFAACTGGFVTFGAEITRVRVGDGPVAAFDLAAPGSWFEVFDGARLRTGPGRPWVIHPPTQVAAAAPARVRIGG